MATTGAGYPMAGATPTNYPPAYGYPGKSRVTAALLAFFLGGLGVHKFYLGRTGAGLAMLFGSLLGFILLFIPNVVVGIIALIDFIVLLAMSDGEFHQRYG